MSSIRPPKVSPLWISLLQWSLIQPSQPFPYGQYFYLYLNPVYGDGLDLVLRLGQMRHTKAKAKLVILDEEVFPVPSHLCYHPAIILHWRGIILIINNHIVRVLPGPREVIFQIHYLTPPGEEEGIGSEGEIVIGLNYYILFWEKQLIDSRLQGGIESFVKFVYPDFSFQVVARDGDILQSCVMSSEKTESISPKILKVE